MIQPEPEGSTQGYPVASVEVLRYDKKSKSKNMGIVSTEMELILEHTQLGGTQLQPLITKWKGALIESRANEIIHKSH
nr:hypothetical protein [Tanacetum cinerariifolium]